MVLGNIAAAVAGKALGSAIDAGIGKLFGGGGTSANKQLAMNQKLMDYQLYQSEQFDSRAIQRRVADAKAAGVSPMAALGMTPGSNFVGSTPSIDYQAVRGQDSGMGQDVSRSMMAAADPMTRLNHRLMNAQIEGQELDNAYKASQIARLTSQVGPSMPGIVNDGKTDMMDFHLDDGGRFRGPGPELGQMMENAPLHGAAATMRDFIHRIKKIFGSYSDYERKAQRYQDSPNIRSFRRKVDPFYN